MGFLLRIGLMVAAVLFAGCVSTPKGPLSLQQQIEHPSTITLELLANEAELLVVKAGFPDDSGGRFVIDTGATLSAIYPDVQQGLGLSPLERSSIRIHGMIAAQLQPITEMPSLRLEQKTLPPFRIAIIPRADEQENNQRSTLPKNDGVIGMDILGEYHLYIDKPNAIIRFIPRALGPAVLPYNWNIVNLTRNPFLEDGRELHFFQLRLGNVLTPALLDTGSQYNMMNWNTKRFPRLRAVKKSLRKNWEIQGAVGTFKPVTKILSKNARAGQKFWGFHEFLVLDFESLDVLGIDGKPFVIAGMPMFSEGAVLMDFENDKLYFEPANNEARKLITIY